ncbi:MAG: DUF2314 domain-containing protein [Hyphomonadaceae bacterium]
MRTFLVSLALLGFVAACGNNAPTEAPPVEQSEAEAAATAQAAALQAATDEARAGLPRFWELQGANDGDAFWLKVAYATPDGGSEQIWLNRIRGGPEGLTGVVQNQPQNLPSLRLNERAPINVNQIYDWSITRGGRTYGHYTTRVILSSRSPEERAQSQAFLDSLEQGLP